MESCVRTGFEEERALPNFHALLHEFGLASRRCWGSEEQVVAGECAAALSAHGGSSRELGIKREGVMSAFRGVSTTLYDSPNFIYQRVAQNHS
jgi:hypothetical protein